LRDLIKRCLKAKPKYRAKIDEIYEHGWFKEMKKLV